MPQASTRWMWMPSASRSSKSSPPRRKRGSPRSQQRKPLRKRSPNPRRRRRLHSFRKFTTGVCHPADSHFRAPVFPPWALLLKGRSDYARPPDGLVPKRTSAEQLQFWNEPNCTSQNSHRCLGVVHDAGLAIGMLSPLRSLRWTSRECTFFFLAPGPDPSSAARGAGWV
jgi:hypothetical protein